MGGLRWLRRALHVAQMGNSGPYRDAARGKSDKVHSIVGKGTWTRMDASNREMSASRVGELQYQRSAQHHSASRSPMDSAAARYARVATVLQGARLGDRAASPSNCSRSVWPKDLGGEMVPLRAAAVLLLQKRPGSLLAVHDARADVRVMVYDSRRCSPAPHKLSQATERTVRGPLIEQIDATVALVLNEIAQGVVVWQWFRAKHAYPEVVKRRL